jgi:hypothetical protein
LEEHICQEIFDCLTADWPGTSRPELAGLIFRKGLQYDAREVYNRGMMVILQSVNFGHTTDEVIEKMECHTRIAKQRSVNIREAVDARDADATPSKKAKTGKHNKIAEAGNLIRGVVLTAAAKVVDANNVTIVEVNYFDIGDISIYVVLTILIGIFLFCGYFMVSRACKASSKSLSLDSDSRVAARGVNDTEDEWLSYKGVNPEKACSAYGQIPPDPVTVDLELAQILITGPTLAAREGKAHLFGTCHTLRQSHAVHQFEICKVCLKKQKCILHKAAKFTKTA